MAFVFFKKEGFMMIFYMKWPCADTGLEIFIKSCEDGLMQQCSGSMQI